MRINLKCKQIILFANLLLLSPIFVLAKDCYVDANTSTSGDGSKSSPYKTITKAIDKGCNKIEIKKGKYEENIALKKGVELKGSGKSTIIIGRVTMHNKTKLDNLYVKDEGIVIADGADVSIKNIKVTGANIGIKTIGEGKLVVSGSEISHGGKGFYLQYGKNVDIRDCDVSHNKEEAIDIRANVDGIITNNIVESNKESGIEVIAGRSSLIITSNKLKHNNASGIAVQFYKSTKQIGHLKISNNTLVGNRRYGVDCKIPSGGNPMPGYWEKSINFKYNNISGNGMGNLAKFCKFSDESILNATKTAKEIEKIKKEETEKKLKAEQDAREKVKILEEKRKRVEEERKREQQKRADLDIADEIEQILQRNIAELENLQEKNTKLQEKRSRIKIFFIGADKEVVNNFEKQITLRKNSLHEGQKLVNKIKTDEVKKAVEKQTNEENDKLKNLQEFYDKYKNQFALIPWVKNLLNLNK